MTYTTYRLTNITFLVHCTQTKVV